MLAIALPLGPAACSGDGRANTTPAAAPAGSPAASSSVQPPAATPAVSVPADASEGRPAGATAPQPPREAAGSDPSIELREQILRVVGSAACREDRECRALPMGSKPCGGPEGYVAWSTAGTDARLLESLAARYREARQTRNQRLGLMSDCAVVSEPAVRCVPVTGAATGAASGGRCQAVPGRSTPRLVTQ